MYVGKDRMLCYRELELVFGFFFFRMQVTLWCLSLHNCYPSQKPKILSIFAFQNDFSQKLICYCSLLKTDHQEENHFIFFYTSDILFRHFPGCTLLLLQTATLKRRQKKKKINKASTAVGTSEGFVSTAGSGLPFLAQGILVSGQEQHWCQDVCT